MWVLRAPAHSPKACTPGWGADQALWTVWHLVLVLTAVQPSYLTFLGLYQPRPLHPDGVLVLGLSATLHLTRLLTSNSQNLSVPHLQAHQHHS